MQTTQRMLLILLVSVLCVLGMAINARGRAEKIQMQQESRAAETFLKKVCRTGIVSLEEYRYFYDSLNNGKNGFVIKIEEYQKEQNLEGENFFYLVTWEELEEHLFKDGEYLLQRESVIKLTVSCRRRRKSFCNEYYGVVSGKDEKL